MRLNAATRARLIADVLLDFDPAGSTVEVNVDGTWYPASWIGSAVKRAVFVNGANVDRWTQTARTTGFFAGPSATPAGAVVLATGRRSTKVRVTGTDVLVNDSTPIDVGA